MDTNNIWAIPEIEKYVVYDIFYIDEVVRKHGFLAIEGEHKIERLFYTYQKKENGSSKVVDLTSEEYFLNFHIEENQYETTLNYIDFKETFYFEAVESILNHDILPDTQYSFLEKINEIILNSEYESKAKYYLNEVLNRLIDFINSLNFLLDNERANDIQKFVINLYVSNYKETIKTIVNRYKSSFNKIIEDFLIENEEYAVLKSENKSTDNKEYKFPHIFESNSFEMWEDLYEAFEIKSNSRTDTKFIFEEMKKDGFIHKIISQKSFLDWIFNTYDGLIIEKTSNHSRTRNRLRDYDIAKSKYLKQ
jgi:flagellin-specific chaperone FliS